MTELLICATIVALIAVVGTLWRRMPAPPHAGYQPTEPGPSEVMRKRQAEYERLVPLLKLNWTEVDPDDLQPGQRYRYNCCDQGLALVAKQITDPLPGGHTVILWVHYRGEKIRLHQGALREIKEQIHRAIRAKKEAGFHQFIKNLEATSNETNHDAK